MKYRIITDLDLGFTPQYKRGLFHSWRSVVGAYGNPAESFETQEEAERAIHRHATIERQTLQRASFKPRVVKRWPQRAPW